MCDEVLTPTPHLHLLKVTLVILYIFKITRVKIGEYIEKKFDYFDILSIIFINKRFFLDNNTFAESFTFPT